MKLLLIAVVGLFFACSVEDEVKEYTEINVEPTRSIERVNTTSDSVYLNWEVFVLSDYTVCDVNNGVNIKINFLIDRPSGGAILGFAISYDQTDNVIDFVIDKSATSGSAISNLALYNFDFDYQGIQSSDVHYFGFKYIGETNRKKVVSAEPSLHPFVCN